MKYIKDRCWLCWLLVVGGWLMLAYALSGCSSQAPASVQGVLTIESDVEFGVAAPAAGTFRPFTTAQTVNVKDFNTAREAFGDGNRTVIVPAGTYVIGKLNIPSNTIILMEPGTIIKDSGQLGPSDRLINIRGENVRIVGHGAKIVANRADYTTGEQRHGVFIADAHNVSIEGLESSGHGGDGFYIGGAFADPSTDIVITGCLADNNRRQGMSIVSAASLYVADCELSNTNGTRPQLGIDLEPNNAGDVLQDVLIVRPRTIRNAGGGITVGLSGFEVGGSGRAATIAIYDHYSEGESPVFHKEGVRSIDRVRVVRTQL